MRLIFFIVLVTIFTACNSGSKSLDYGDASSHDHLAMGSSVKSSTEKVNAHVIRASFSSVNADAVAHINAVLNHYSHMAHALTKDDVTSVMLSLNVASVIAKKSALTVRAGMF